MVNSRIKGIVAGLTVLYSLGCQNDTKTENEPLELAIIGTSYTLMVNPTSFYEERVLRDILSEKTKGYVDFEYNSIKKTLKAVCVPDSTLPDSTLNHILSKVDANKDNTLTNEEVSNYSPSLPD